MGVPPPKATAIGFATKAGRKNHKACGIASRAIAAGVGSWPGYRESCPPDGPEPPPQPIRMELRLFRGRFPGRANLSVGCVNPVASPFRHDNLRIIHL